MVQVDQAKVMTLCKLIESILFDEKMGDLAKDPAKAKSAGGKSGGKFRPKHIHMDEDFFNGRHKIAMENGQRAKYTSDVYSQKILLLTKDAKLVHLMKVRGKPSEKIK